MDKLVIPEQRAKADESIFVTPSGISSSVNPLHPLNAMFPMVLRLLPNVSVVAAEQPLNAELPISVTVSGRLIANIFEHFENADDPTSRRLFPKVTLTIFEQL